MRSRLFSVVVFASLSLAGSGLVGACTNQGEGEVCSPNANDCQSQYECIVVANNGYRCCPIPPAQPDANNVCAPNNPGVSGGNVPPEGGAADDAPSTGTTDGGGGAVTETSTPTDTGSPPEASIEAGDAGHASDSASPQGGAEGSATAGSDATA